MSKKLEVIPQEVVELLDEPAFSLQELANCCAVSSEWLIQHVHEETITPLSAAGERPEGRQWRFSAQTRVRVHRIAWLEQTYDADPQLAALAADLMEEISSLRSKLKTSGSF